MVKYASYKKEGQEYARQIREYKETIPTGKSRI